MTNNKVSKVYLYGKIEPPTSIASNSSYLSTHFSGSKEETDIRYVYQNNAEKEGAVLEGLCSGHTLPRNVECISFQASMVQ